MYSGRQPPQGGRSFAPLAGKMLSNTAHANSRGEILVGRTMAACVHPCAAWHSRVRSFRVLLLAGYFAAGYIGGLVAIVLTN